MENVTSKLNRIKNAKESIKSSIEAKGVEVGDVSIEEYAEKINQIVGTSDEQLNVTPSAEEQVYEGQYGKVVVAGDSNLVADNIKEGTSIFGVEGNAKTTNLKITDARYLFYVGTRLDILNELLALCENIESTSNMFYNCNLMKSIDLTILNTSRVKDMSYMFYYNGYLKDVNLSSCDFGKVETLVYMFRNCTALENLLFGKNLGKGYTIKQNNYSSQKLDLSASTKLTHESLMNVINNLYDLNLTYDVANGGTLYTQTLSLGSTNLAKLTPEEIRNCNQ
jgi:surface protein